MSPGCACGCELWKVSSPSLSFFSPLKTTPNHALPGLGEMARIPYVLAQEHFYDPGDMSPFPALAGGEAHSSSQLAASMWERPLGAERVEGGGWHLFLSLF